MSSVSDPDEKRQPHRPHFIKEWAEKQGLTPTDLARAVGADKSVISRWYSGSTPDIGYQEKLAQLFGCSREALFRKPEEEQIYQLFRARTDEEVGNIMRLIEAVFPRKPRN